MPSRSSPFARRLLFAAQRSPFTINTVLWVAALWAAWRVIRRNGPVATATQDEAGTGLRAFIHLMASLAFWFFVVLVVLSALSAVAAWLYYRWQRAAGGARLDVSFATPGPRETGKLALRANVSGALRPLLGWVRGRLFYDDLRLTPHFSLLSGGMNSGVRGESPLLLPDVKEYTLRGSFLFFEDMLRVLSLPVREDLAGHFYQPPTAVLPPEADVAPRKTESLDVRIDQMRRVEGDPLAYKDFEPGDDVRRIVWKVYARNRELVVRMPERFEPYASHLYLYASFHAGLPGALPDGNYAREMLNYYKARVWTVYETLEEKEFQMRYIPDQQLTLPETADAREQALRAVSNSAWQRERPLADYFNPRAGAVLIVSSFTDVDDLREALGSAAPGAVVYFVKLSAAFRHPTRALGWALRLVLRPPADRLGRLRSRWPFSPLRRRLRTQEAALETVLAERAADFAIL